MRLNRTVLAWNADSGVSEVQLPSPRMSFDVLRSIASAEYGSNEEENEFPMENRRLSNDVLAVVLLSGTQPVAAVAWHQDNATAKAALLALVG